MRLATTIRAIAALITLLITACACQAEVRWRPAGCVYPKKVYRGKPFFFQCPQGYVDAFQVTNIDVERLTITVPNHNFTGSSTIHFISSNLSVDSTVYGVLPDVYNPYLGFGTEVITGDTMTLNWRPISGANGRIVEYGTNLGSAYGSGAGGSELMAGTGTAGQVPGDGSSRISNVVLPTGFSIIGTWQIGGNSVKVPITGPGGVYTTGDGSTTFNAQIMVAANAPTGPQQITFTGAPNGTCCTGQSKDYTLSVEVLDTNSIVPWLGNRPAPVAWPGTLLADWEAVLLQRLNYWCNTATGETTLGPPPPAFSGGAASSQLSFYDGTDTYDQAFHYFGTAGYAGCSNYIAKRSLNPLPDGYVFPGLGIVQTWMGFTNGFSSKARFGKSGGPQGSRMLHLNPSTAIVPRVTNSSIRPTFFVPAMVIDVVSNAGYSYDAHPSSYSSIVAKGQEAIEDLLICFDNIAEMGTTYSSQYKSALGYPHHQNFMWGYAMRSLVDWWNWTGRSDNRIPYMIQKYMDFHNSFMWIPGLNTIRWVASVHAPGTGNIWSVTQNAGVTGSLIAACPGPGGCTLTFATCPAAVTVGQILYLAPNSDTQSVEPSEVVASTCTSGSVSNGTVAVVTTRSIPTPWYVRAGGAIRQGIGCAQNCWFNSVDELGTQLAAMSIPFNAWLWKNGAGDSYRQLYDDQLAAYNSISLTAPSATAKIMNEDMISGMDGVYWRNLQDPPH